MIRSNDKIAKREPPMYSLDIKLPVTTTISMEYSQNEIDGITPHQENQLNLLSRSCNIEETIDKCNILPELRQNIESKSRASRIKFQKSTDSLDSISNNSIADSPYQSELNMHISNYRSN